MLEYPKHVYLKSENEKGFEAKLVSSKEQLDAITGKWFNSPSEFGIETHPQAKIIADENVVSSAQYLEQELVIDSILENIKPKKGKK